MLIMSPDDHVPAVAVLVKEPKVADPVAPDVWRQRKLLAEKLEMSLQVHAHWLGAAALKFTTPVEAPPVPTVTAKVHGPKPAVSDGFAPQPEPR